MKLRKPYWFKVHLSDTTAFEVHKLMENLNLHTVCKEAHCPNIGECFGRRTAAFLILGDLCTRNCKFCAIKPGIPLPPDPQEPQRVAEAARRLNLKYCVITGVNRDDLPLGGAEHYAETIRQVKLINPGIEAEVLPGDFSGSKQAVRIVIDTEPKVFNHNLETVERLTPLIRDRRANYHTSLKILRIAKEIQPDILTKSGLIIGLGETEDEIISAFKDLRSVGCDGITIGQYIPPSKTHHPVAKYYTPEAFQALAGEAYNLGFRGVASAPLVRSSYRAGDFFRKR